MAEHVSIILKGIILGFSIAAPVGVIGTLCIRQSLAGGFWLGFLTGLGAATADALYGVIAGFGLSVIQDYILAYQKLLAFFGGLFLCYVGMKTFFAPLMEKDGPKADTHLLHAYLATFLLTLTNPMTILAFTAMLSGLELDVTNYSIALFFVGGVFIGSAVWWLILSSIVSLFRSRFSMRLLRYVNKISGVIIMIFGIGIVLSAFSYCTDMVGCLSDTIKRFF